MLTGSKSKGKYKHYYYYHCLSECGVRYNALEANEIFVSQLKDYNINPAASDLIKAVITSVYKNRTRNEFSGKKQLLEDINKQNEKLSKARALLLEGDIDASDYKTIKAECEDTINRLEAKLANVSASPLVKISVETLINKVIDSLTNLDERYLKADVNRQRHIVSSLYPEKLHFDGLTYRTPKPNVIVDAILLINREIEGIKKGKEGHLKPLSLIVARRGIEPCS